MILCSFFIVSNAVFHDLLPLITVVKNQGEPLAGFLEFLVGGGLPVFT
jgi:hypothetical protein